MRIEFDHDTVERLTEALKSRGYESINDLIDHFEWAEETLHAVNYGLVEVCNSIGIKSQGWNATTMLDIIKHHISDKAEEEAKP